MPEWWEDADLINAVTAVVRQADAQFDREGGSSRHWVRDCFLPALADAGTLADPKLLRTILAGTGLEVREGFFSAEPEGTPHEAEFTVRTTPDEWPVGKHGPCLVVVLGGPV